MREAKRTVVVSLRLDEATHAELTELAKADRRPVASLLALIVEDWIKAKHQAAGERPRGRGKV